MQLFLNIFTFLCLYLKYSHCQSVQIETKEYVNLVSDKFLSFTIDPKFLLSDKAPRSKECLCMVSSLSPGYIRIAGPSTSFMDFHDKSILLNADAMNDRVKNHFERIDSKKGGRIYKRKQDGGSTMINFDEWTKFANWAAIMNFTVVFALNEDEKMESGIWDPNTALNILSVAEKAGIGEIVWQLGYECNNQTVEEYVNDLETLRLMVDSTKQGSKGVWKVTSGDVTKCLGGDSRRNFKDFVEFVDDSLDFVFLNGNSSASELECIRKEDREAILKLFSSSPTPLWITESSMNDVLGELERAVDWMNSLGFSARNGFTTHFREIAEHEMYEPTLSFYMSLLFKNLVGRRVLDVTMAGSDMSVSDDSSIFAHCTSLKKTPVEGAVTLYGTNMAEVQKKFSVKMKNKENGGDIMQFVLNLDRSGNILINGHLVIYAGDIRPVLKRVRPYKTLILTLPPKSFGFWVIANTNVEACQDIEEPSVDLLDATPIKDFVIEKEEYKHRGKREIDTRKKTTLLDLENLDREFNRVNSIFATIENIIAENESELQDKGYLRTKRAKRQATLKDLIDKFVLNKTSPKPLSSMLSKKAEPLVPKTVSLSLNSDKTKILGLGDQLKKDTNSIVHQLDTNTRGLLKRFKTDIPALTTTQNPLKKFIDSNNILKSLGNNVATTTPKSLKNLLLDPKKSINLRAMINDAITNLKATNPHKIIKRYASNMVDKNSKKRYQYEKREVAKIGKRQKRSLYFDDSVENEIESNDIEHDPKIKHEITKKPFPRLSKIIHKVGKQFEDLPQRVFQNIEKSPVAKIINKGHKTDNNDADAIVDKLSIESKITDEDATLSFREKSNENGMFRAALEKLVKLFRLRSRGSRILKLLPLLT